MSTVLKPLYQEVDQYEAALDWIEEHAAEIEAAGGELPEELEQLMEDVEGHITEKAGRIGLVIRNIVAQVSAVAVERKRLQEREATLTRQAEVLKKYLRVQLGRVGISKIDNPICPVRIQTNGGKPSITVTDENLAKLAGFYVVPEPVFSASAAMDRIGDMLPKGPFEMDVVAFGIRVERGTHVRVG